MFSPEDPELADTTGLILEGALNWSIFSERTMFDLEREAKCKLLVPRHRTYYLQTGARLTVTQRLFGPFGLQGVCRAAAPVVPLAARRLPHARL